MITYKYRPVFLSGAFWIAIVVFQVAGCSDAETQSVISNDITYVCLETHEVMELPKTETPAINPETGKRTLVEGRYCKKCKKWYPFPQIQGEGGQPAQCVCPKHGHALVARKDSL